MAKNYIFENGSTFLGEQVVSRVLLTLSFFISAWIAQGQIFDITRSHPYRAVFTETDDFDSTYLTDLEKAYRQSLPDSLKLAIGNDLAYYWHTRNLDKALQWADTVYQLAVSTDSLVWQCRL